MCVCVCAGGGGGGREVGVTVCTPGTSPTQLPRALGLSGRGFVLGAYRP